MHDPALFGDNDNSYGDVIERPDQRVEQMGFGDGIERSLASPDAIRLGDPIRRDRHACLS
ncbi:MAG TPA: hypothetical protein VIB38_01985 [Aestuariivirgaceae bacterium]